MTAAVFDARYLPDTDVLFDRTVRAQSIAEAAAQAEGAYDIISAGCYLDELPLEDLIGDLERLHALLAPGGILILPVRNPGSAYEIDRMMHTGSRDVYAPEGTAMRYAVIPYRQLLRALYAHSQLRHHRLHSIVVETDSALAERMKPLLHPDADAAADLEMSLLVEMFFLGIEKPGQ